MPVDAPQRPPVEVRDQYGTIADVQKRERVIDVLVVPYNEDTTVEYRGQLVTESVLPGAFAGLETNPGRVTVQRDHKVERAVGLAVSVDPTPTEGLIASLRISRTPLGDETLELADDGVLQPSIGMAVRQKDQRWSEGNRRRQILRAFLDHVGMVPQQAYLGAKVLAVRSSQPDDDLWTPPATPRVDEALAFAARTSAMLEAARAAR